MNDQDFDGLMKMVMVSVASAVMVSLWTLLEKSERMILKLMYTENDW